MWFPRREGMFNNLDKAIKELIDSNKKKENMTQNISDKKQEMAFLLYNGIYSQESKEEICEKLIKCDPSFGGIGSTDKGKICEIISKYKRSRKKLEKSIDEIYEILDSVDENGLEFFPPPIV